MIDEIIVWNNNPDFTLKTHDNVTVINCSKDMGLYTRFAMGALAKNKAIMFHDDDLLASEDTVNALYKEWNLRGPDRCFGIFGRDTEDGNYSFKNSYGEVDVILTRCVITSRKVCRIALSNLGNFDDIKGIPVGNGEDIILSYAASFLSHQKNISLNLPIEEFEEDEVSMHRRSPNWLQFRSKIVQRCQSVFAHV